MTTKADRGLASTDLVAFAPCGCWMAVMVESLDLLDNAKRVSEFMRDVARGGGGRVQQMSHEAFCELRNGVNGDLKHGCDHEPQWGGLVATHRYCPRCHKDVKILKNGRLAAHREVSWSREPCSQQPRGERGVA